MKWAKLFFFIYLPQSISVPLRDGRACIPSTHLFFCFFFCWAGAKAGPAICQTAQSHAGSLQTAGGEDEMLSVLWCVWSFSCHCLELLIDRSLTGYLHAVSMEFPLPWMLVNQRGPGRTVSTDPLSFVRFAHLIIKLHQLSYNFRLNSVLSTEFVVSCKAKNRTLVWSNRCLRTPGGSSSAWQ